MVYILAVQVGDGLCSFTYRGHRCSPDKFLSKVEAGGHLAEVQIIFIFINVFSFVDWVREIDIQSSLVVLITILL